MSDPTIVKRPILISMRNGIAFGIGAGVGLFGVEWCVTPRHVQPTRVIVELDHDQVYGLLRSFDDSERYADRYRQSFMDRSW
jgi:hypothetical protein